MGGCCCCLKSKGVELNTSPPCYHYPRVSDEHGPLSSHTTTASGLSTGLLVDTNLETSIPDTYRPPPTPLPFNANLGHPHETNTEADPVEVTNTVSTHETTAKDLKESDGKLQTDNELAVLQEVEDDLEKSGELKKSTEPIVPPLEEEDVCPTCFEEYDAENPKIITKCEHHFHLSCILEWLERSDTCPVCDQEMIFDPTITG